MKSSMRSLLFLLLLLAVGAPPAFGAPGDATPDFGDDDEDEDEDETATEEDAAEEDAVEADAVEEDAVEEDAVEEDAVEEDAVEEDAVEEDAAEDAVEEDAVEEDDAAEDDAAEDDADEEEYDPLKGLNLPGEDDRSGGNSADDEDSSDDEDSGDAETKRAKKRTRFDAEESTEPSETKEELEARLDEKKSKKKRLVKVIQHKFFLKYRRLEVVPNIGYIGNDNFIRRLHVGLGLSYHINDILGIELNIGYLPNLGNNDYKPLTLLLQRAEEVVPDISRVVFSGLLGATISPIFGKVELGALRIINYDLYFTAGAGVVQTTDDTEIIKSDCDGLTVRERKSEEQRVNGCYLVDQTHFASFFGGGIRIVFNKWIGIKLDVRNITHIEQAWRSGDIGLEMKHSLLVSVGASFFLPPEPRRL